MMRHSGGEYAMTAKPNFQRSAPQSTHSTLPRYRRHETDSTSISTS